MKDIYSLIIQTAEDIDSSVTPVGAKKQIQQYIVDKYGQRYGITLVGGNLIISDQTPIDKLFDNIDGDSPAGFQIKNQDGDLIPVQLESYGYQQRLDTGYIICSLEDQTQVTIQFKYPKRTVVNIQKLAANKHDPSKAVKGQYYETAIAVLHNYHKLSKIKVS